MIGAIPYGRIHGAIRQDSEAGFCALSLPDGPYHPIIAPQSGWRPPCGRPAQARRRGYTGVCDDPKHPQDRALHPQRARAPLGRRWLSRAWPVWLQRRGRGRAQPFLLLDYAAPTTFTPTTRAAGWQPPHRGFETVTISSTTARWSTATPPAPAASSERATLRWMTAGGGIIHEEFTPAPTPPAGGPFEMVQL